MNPILTTVLIILLFLLVVFIVWIITSNNMFNKLIKNNEKAEKDLDDIITKRNEIMEIALAFLNKNKVDVKSIIKKKKEISFDSNERIKEKEEFASIQTELVTEIINLFIENKTLQEHEEIRVLREESIALEDLLATARRYYNSNISIYNKRLVTFPFSVMAGWKNLNKKDFFEAENYNYENNVNGNDRN